MFDPVEAAQEWATQTKAKVNKYKKGIERTTKDPTALAAAAVNKWQANVSSTQAQAKFQAGLRRAGKGKWQQRAVEKGARNIAAGVDAAQADMAKYMQEAAATYQQIASEMATLPTMTEADMDARMLRNAQIMREFGRRRAGLA